MKIKQIEDIEAFVVELLKEWGPPEEYFTPTERCKNYFKKEFVKACSFYDNGDYEYLADTIKEIVYEMKNIHMIREDEELREDATREACDYLGRFFEKRYPDCWEGMKKPWWK